MIDLTKSPKYFYQISVDGMIDKYHISKIGNHNQVKANPASVMPGRSSRWFENDDNVFATEEEAKKRLSEMTCYNGVFMPKGTLK